MVMIHTSLLHYHETRENMNVLMVLLEIRLNYRIISALM